MSVEEKIFAKYRKEDLSRYRNAVFVDPFTQRLARDIRNTLSESFVSSIGKRDPSLFENACRKWLELPLPEVYRDYMGDRLMRYRGVCRRIEKEGIWDPLHQGVVVWNQELFFEFHEHLEQIWKSSSGAKREALKGLIKAAGFYIHQRHGHQDAAARLASKAADLVERHRGAVSAIIGIDELIERLRRCDTRPPLLRFDPHPHPSR